MPQEESCHITYNDKLKNKLRVEIFLCHLSKLVVMTVWET